METTLVGIAPANGGTDRDTDFSFRIAGVVNVHVQNILPCTRIVDDLVEGDMKRRVVTWRRRIYLGSLYDTIRSEVTAALKRQKRPDICPFNKIGRRVAVDALEG